MERGVVLGALLWFLASACHAQDLEPRRWTHLPTGLNVLGIGAGRTDGDIFFDPVLLIEDATFELYGLGATYVRTFEWLGKSSRIDVTVPYANGRWEGLLDGESASRRRSGLADPRIRLSMNLYGAPPLTLMNCGRAPTTLSTFTWAGPLELVAVWTANPVKDISRDAWEELLNIADYDYAWQLGYQLRAPKLMPAGTVLTAVGAFDNSAQNPMNPDPDRSVPWGQQSWDEMFFGSFRWKYTDQGGDD